MTKTKSSLDVPVKTVDDETSPRDTRWASELDKLEGAHQGLPIPEITLTQHRQRSFSLSKVSLPTFSQRKRSIDVLAPLQANVRSSSQTKLGSRRPKLKASKSSPNFQEYFAGSVKNTDLERLESVDDQDLVEDDFQGLAIRKVQSNDDLTSSFPAFHTPRFDAEDTSNRGHLSSSPKLSTPRSARTGLLQPILNPPKIGRGLSHSSLSTSVLSGNLSHAVSPVSARRNSSSIVDSLRKKTPLNESPDTNHVGDTSHNNRQWQIGDEIFHGRPRADAQLNLRYTPDELLLPTSPYTFTSKPNTPLFPITRVLQTATNLHDTEIAVTDPNAESFQFHDQTDFDMEGVPSSLLPQKPASPQTREVNSFPSYLTQGMSEVTSIKYSKPFVTIEELDELSSTQSSDTKVPSSNSDSKDVDKGEQTRDRDTSGIYITEEAAVKMFKVGKHLLVNHKPAADTTAMDTQDKVAVQMQKTAMSSSGEVSTSPKKTVLSARAVRSTNRLYESPRKTQVRMPSATFNRGQKLAKVKSKSQLSNEEAKSTPQRTTKPKKVGSVVSKPSGLRPKKPVRMEESEKPKNERNKSEKISKNGNSSRLKKGSEIEAKTEKMLQRMEEKVLGTQATNRGSKSAKVGAGRPKNIPTTPVIQDAYPKFDDGERKLLEKVRVTVADVHYPRRIHSSVPRKCNQPLPGKKLKPKDETSEPSSPKAEEKEAVPSPKRRKPPRATSAGLIVEKGKRDGNCFVAMGEEIGEIDAENYTIFSGKNWSVIAPKNQQKMNDVTESKGNANEIDDSVFDEPARKNDILGENAGLKMTAEGSQEHVENRVQIDTQEHAENGMDADVEFSIKDMKFSLSSDETSLSSDKSPMVSSKTVSTSEERSPHISENDLPNDSGIEVIPLVDDHATGHPGEVTRLKYRIDARVLKPSVLKDEVAMGHSFISQKGEIVVTQDSANDGALSLFSADDRSSHEVWSKEEEEGSLTDDDSDEEILDVNHNLQKLMKSMRQRSELDAHTLVNYRKPKIDDSDAESIYKSENCENHLDFSQFEDEFLACFFENSSERSMVTNAANNARLYDGSGTLTPRNVLLQGPSREVATPQKSVNHTTENKNAYCDVPIKGIPEWLSNTSGAYHHTDEDNRVEHHEISHVDHLAGVIYPGGNSDRQSNSPVASVRWTRREENEPLPFQHYHVGLSGESGDFYDSTPHDTDEEILMENLKKTLHEEAYSDDNADVLTSAKLDDGTCDKLVNRPKLTKESLKLHNRQQSMVAPTEGTDEHHLRKERENMISRMSSATGTTDTQDTHSTLKGELDTAACLGWRKGKELGHGSYGTVYEGLTRDGKLIAVKIVELTVSNRAMAKKEFQQVQAEVGLLKTLRHGNVVQLLGTSLVNSTVQIFMEHVPGGSISSLLLQYGSLEERIFRKYTKQILTGVEYLHGCSVVHRDIKGSNVMLMTCGVIKLIDFGCAKRLKESAFLKESNSSHDEKLLQSLRGTPYWMAPEVIVSHGHGPKSDVWSVGCTVYEMATTKPPLRHLEPPAAMFRIGNGEEMPILPRSEFSRSTVKFVKKCLTREPRERPTASELLQHKFITRHKARPSSRK